MQKLLFYKQIIINFIGNTYRESEETETQTWASIKEAIVEVAFLLVPKE